MQSKMESVGLKFCSPGANEKEKQEGNPLREVIQLIFVCKQLFLSELRDSCKVLKTTAL